MANLSWASVVWASVVVACMLGLRSWSLGRVRKGTIANEEPEQEQSNVGKSEQYDVFLNHRGPDLKKSFVSHLNKSLIQAGCNPFLDVKSLETGKYAWNSIKEALNGVHVHVAIFSPGYAESKYCLKELCIMLESQKIVIPVFYNIEPYNLREPEVGPFAKAFKKHLKKGRKNDVEIWKRALRQASEISGIVLNACNNDTVKLEEEVVSAVLKALPAHPIVGMNHDLVGLEETLTDVINIVHKMGNNLGILGICGMGGIGKTTLARKVYNHEQSNFRSRYFAKDVKEATGINFTNMQKDMAAHLLCMDVKDLHWDSVRWFHQIREKKVLLVIDDVSKKEQVYELIPILKDLGDGSRVLITSRDENVLKEIMKDISQSQIFFIPQLSFSNSLHLFVRFAFRRTTFMM